MKCLRAVLYLIIWFAIFIPQDSAAQPIIECPALQLELSVVDFSGPDCKNIVLGEYQMSGHSMWLKFSLPVDQDLQNSKNAVGLFISGPISAKVFVNGYPIGEKGRSGLDYDTEIPGSFDWVGYVPKTILLDSNNQIEIHISNFHRKTSDFHAFNTLYFDVYSSPTQQQLIHYWPTSIPLGALLLSLFYLLRRLSLEPKTTNLAGLFLLTASTTLQLITEVLRGFYPYAYPMHDIRLNLILMFAFVFGQALLMQVIHQFTKLKKRYLMGFSVGLVLVIQFLIDDRDLKATSVIQIPALIAACLITFELYRKHTHQYTPVIILLGFSALIFAAPYHFLDVYLYYCMAGLLAYFLNHEVLNRTRRERELAIEKQRAQQLQLILELKTQDHADQSIGIKEAGKITMLKIQNILFCKGAGDYVEICLTDKAILHSGSLNNIIQQLPSYFIKVHRSYLVNAKHITTMRRLPTGTGEIELSSGITIPVSRRLLPKLKETLAATD